MSSESEPEEPSPRTHEEEHKNEFWKTSNEWHYLIAIFRNYFSDDNKSNIKKAGRQWKEVVDTLQEMQYEMGYLQHAIERGGRDLIFVKSHTAVIRSKIKTIMEWFRGKDVPDMKCMVEMKIFRQGPNGLWGGAIWKCHRLFNVYVVHLFCLLRRIFDHFHYHNQERYPIRIQWQDFPQSVAPEGFGYQVPYIAVQLPNGDPAVAVALNEEEYLEKEASSDYDSHDSDDDVSHRVVDLGFASDSEAHYDEAQMQSMLRNLKQLSML